MSCKNQTSFSLHRNMCNPKISCISLLLITLFFAGCSAGEIKSEKAASFNADLGIRYLQNGRLQLANEKLVKALDQNPNSAAANHYFAILQQRLGSTAKATQYFNKALKLDPKDPEIRNNYGSFLCDNGKPQAALQQFNVSINDPLYTTPEFAYTNAGICLRKIGDHNKAEEYFRNALKKKSAFPSALLEMASLYHDRKRYPRAQAFISRYETVGKSSPKALELCALINQKMSNPTKSASCKSTLLRLFPESAEAQRSS